jgi:hypothetical protein
MIDISDRQHAPSESVNDEGKRDAYLDLKGCLIIFNGSVAYESKH